MFEEVKLEKELQKKFLRLHEIIKNSQSAVVAFSSGVDSTLLAFITHQLLAEKSLAVTINSEFFAASELKDATELAEKLGFNHTIISLSVLDNEQVYRNDPLRCKYCKEAVFGEIVKIAEKNGFRHIFDGANIDDIADYRPGFEATRKYVISPFIEANLTKYEIRLLSKVLNLPNWNKPALACLASRIPYGTVIIGDILEKIQKAESELTKLGYEGFRVRHHGDLARIELDIKDFDSFISDHREQIDSKLKKMGYNYVCLDLKGYRTGSLNAALEKTS